MTLNLGKIPIRWEEVWKHFGTDLDPRTVIHVWLSTETMVDVTNHGYNGIYSVDGQYYLDALGEYHMHEPCCHCTSSRDAAPHCQCINALSKPFHGENDIDRCSCWFP